MRIVRKLVVGVAIAVFFGVAASSALATPVWEQCIEGGAGTKYETNQCVKASGTGKWAWSEVTGTEAVKGRSSLTLKDTKVPIVGTVEVKCTGAILGAVSQGTIGPGKFARLTKAEEIQCSPGKNCEKLEEVAKPLNLPWQTELAEESGKVRGKITATNGKGPGWAVKCKVLGISKTDECTTENSSGAIENAVSNGELLVRGIFDAKSANGNCTIGGSGASVQEGAGFIASPSGGGLRVRGA